MKKKIQFKNISHIIAQDYYANCLWYLLYYKIFSSSLVWCSSICPLLRSKKDLVIYSEIRTISRPVLMTRASFFIASGYVELWTTSKKYPHTSILTTLYHSLSSSRCPQGRRSSLGGGSSGVRRSISCLITPAPLSSILTIHPVDTIHCIPIILIILLVVPLVMELEEV